VKALWGSNLFSFYPLVLTALVAFGALVLLVPRVARSLDTQFRKVSLAAASNRTAFWLIAGGLGCTLLVLGLYFHESIPLLGDGTLRKNEIAHGLWLHPTEFLDFLLHSLLYQYVFAPSGLKAILVYRVLSAGSGLAFVVGIFCLARFLSKSQIIPVAAALLASGTVILFFGYVESYSIFAALVPWLLLAGLRSFSGGREKLIYFGLYLIASATHLAAAVIFAPSIITVALAGRKTTPSELHRINWLMLWLVVIGTCGAYVVGWLGIDIVHRNLVPLLPSDSRSVSILGGHHLIGVFNWLTLCALPGLMLLPAVVGSVRKLWSDSRPQVSYALWVLIPAAMFLMFFNPILGPARDWDLFSVPSFILLAAIVIIYVSVREEGLPPQLWSVILVGASLVFAFAGINSTPTRSAERFAELIDQSQFKNKYMEWALLYSHAENYPELDSVRISYAEQAWNAPPRSLKDTLYIGGKLAHEYVAAGDRDPAHHIIMTLLSSDSTDVNNYLLQRDFLERWGSDEQLRQLGHRIASRFPSDGRAQMEAGVILMSSGETQAGGQLLKRAYELNSDDPLILVNYGNYTLQNRNPDLAMSCFGRALAMDSSLFDAQYGLAATNYYLGSLGRAREFLSKAAKLAKTSRDQSRVKDLQAALDK
jgi:tetratricopeptide (TPR) repeat protein